MDDQPRHLSAVTLAVREIDRSVAFYRALGFELERGEANFATFRVGRVAFNLQRVPETLASPGWGRVIFRVVDVDGLYADLCRAGITTEAAPADASWGERFFHVKDPDGHEISFAQPLEELP